MFLRIRDGSPIFHNSLRHKDLQNIAGQRELPRQLGRARLRCLRQRRHDAAPRRPDGVVCLPLSMRGTAWWRSRRARTWTPGDASNGIRISPGGPSRKQARQPPNGLGASFRAGCAGSSHGKTARKPLTECHWAASPPFGGRALRPARSWLLFLPPAAGIIWGVASRLSDRERSGSMAAGDIGPVGGAVAAAAAPKLRRTIFGRIGLVLSLVPWAFFGAMCLIKPG